MHTMIEFETLVKTCIAAAEAKYGKMPAISIRFDLKGKAAGMAGCRINRITRVATDLFVRFTREAMAKDWDNMVQQTISHEIAHLVAYAFPALGAKNHNYVWERIDRSLGGAGERCHKMELTPARKTNRYKYVLDSGREVLVGPKHHNALQSGRTLRMKKSNEIVARQHFKGAA